MWERSSNWFGNASYNVFVTSRLSDTGLSGSGYRGHGQNRALAMASLSNTMCSAGLSRSLAIHVVAYSEEWRQGRPTGSAETLAVNAGGRGPS